MYQKITLGEFVRRFPFVLREIYRGGHLMISHKGRNLFSVVPVKDLRRLESLELADLEDSNSYEHIKQIVKDLQND